MVWQFHLYLSGCKNNLENKIKIVGRFTSRFRDSVGWTVTTLPPRPPNWLVISDFGHTRLQCEKHFSGQTKHQGHLAQWWLYFFCKLKNKYHCRDENCETRYASTLQKIPATHGEWTNTEWTLNSGQKPHEVNCKVTLRTFFLLSWNLSCPMPAGYDPPFPF